MASEPGPSDQAIVLPTQPVQGWQRATLALIQALFAILSLAPLATLYVFAWRIFQQIGHWPLAWVDDPKFTAPNDALSDVLYWSVLCFGFLSLIGSVAFLLFSWLLRRAYPRWWTFLLLAIFILSWLIARNDHSDLWRWYFD